MDNQNPFLQILQQSKSQNPSMGMGQGMAPAMAAQQAMPQGQVGPDGEMIPGVETKGVTADATKPLIQAAQAIHNFISEATNREDIAIGRSILTLLAKLLNQDQQRASQVDQQGPEQGIAPEDEQY